MQEGAKDSVYACMDRAMACKGQEPRTKEQESQRPRGAKDHVGVELIKDQ